jgi:ribosomal protein L11 methyltransferase
MIELRWACSSEVLDIFSEALEAIGALSVSVEDCDALTHNEKPLFGEPNMPIAQQGWNRSRVLALFASESQVPAVFAALKNQDFFVQCHAEDSILVPDQDWVSLTQSHFTPIEVTPNFWVVPSWDVVPIGAKTSIRLDPGMAFGTGTHPTTFMCLRWIANGVCEGNRVLDFGCGSGILAIASAKFHASAVTCVDIDPVAIACALTNAQNNNVAIEILDADSSLGTFDVVIANILALPLKILAEKLVSCINENGVLVLSGILEEQAHEIQSAYAPYINLIIADQVEEWVMLTGSV